MSRSIIAPARRVNLLPAGIVAGIIGGILIDAFLFAIGGRFPSMHQWIASGIVGSIAYTSVSYALLGIVLHFAASIAWGVAYLSLARRIGPAALDRPIVSGTIFGVIVWAVMQLVLVPAHLWKAPASTIALILSLVAHTLFFGIPVALYVRAAVRKSLPAA